MKDGDIRVSVCMAVYNGEAYIEEQIRSILSELLPCDELIVVNDATLDRSMNIVDMFDDGRIRVFNLNKNVGHVRAFEVALLHARGEYIFFSDQDDVWLQGKVNRVLQLFESDSDVCYVYHDLRLVDKLGIHLPKQWKTCTTKKWNSLEFIVRHVFQPQVFGCGSAVSRKVVPVSLPFPKTTYAHEHWLALCAAMVGKVQFASDVLVDYRQHGANLTPKRRNGLIIVVRCRMALLYQMCVALFRAVKIRLELCNISQFLANGGAK